MIARCITFLCLLPFFCACTRAPLKRREQALRPTSVPRELGDDLPLAPLLGALKQEIALFQAPAQQGGVLLFGERKITRAQYAAGLAYLVQLGEGPEPSAFWKALREEFDFYEVYGRDRWGEVLVTSYYEPELHGARTPTAAYPRALYRTPPDLVAVQLPSFDDRFADLTVMRGRLVPERAASGALALVSYYDRKQIDGDKALAGRKLELCYVDPVDAFFLQIQGSGTVVFDDRSQLRVGYADQNGQKYEAIGKYVSAISLDAMTSQNLEAYVRSLSPDARDQLLFRNPSYIFFHELQGPALSSLGVPVVPERTIATDGRYFPKGALALLEFQKPRFAAPTDETPSGQDTVRRLVLDQDVGGAIRGGGRVDLYWGSGNGAKRYAGHIKSAGHLVYAAPGDALLRKLAGQ